MHSTTRVPAPIGVPWRRIAPNGAWGVISATFAATQTRLSVTFGDVRNGSDAPVTQRNCCLNVRLVAEGRTLPSMVQSRRLRLAAACRERMLRCLVGVAASRLPCAQCGGACWRMVVSRAWCFSAGALKGFASARIWRAIGMGSRIRPTAMRLGCMPLARGAGPLGGGGACRGPPAPSAAALRQCAAGRVAGGWPGAPRLAGACGLALGDVGALDVHPVRAAHAAPMCVGAAAGGPEPLPACAGCAGVCVGAEGEASVDVCDLAWRAVKGG